MNATEEAECNDDSIFAPASQKHILNSTLESILVELLTEDGKDMAYALQNPQFAQNKLNWTYNTKEGDGFINEIK
jgi:hypothetical protein